MAKVADRFLAEHPELLHADETSPERIHRLSELLAPLEAYHRLQVRGLENVPNGGCLLVANHSSGVLSEVLLMLRAWHKRFGDRPVKALSHQVFWQFPFSLLEFQKIGAVLAHPDVARRKLQEGDTLLTFPGGDQEAWRPFSERYEVTLGGRTGFVSLAREAGVPIIPVVICGSHTTNIALPGGKALARYTALGKLFGIKVVPLTAGSIFWGLSSMMTIIIPPLLPLLPLFATAGFLQGLLPLPSRIEIEVMEPMTPRDDETNAAFAERLRAAMQETMDRLAAGRLTPWG